MFGREEKKKEGYLDKRERKYKEKRMRERIVFL